MLRGSFEHSTNGEMDKATFMTFLLSNGVQLSPIQRNVVLADSSVSWREFVKAMKTDMRQQGRLNDKAPALDNRYELFNEFDEGRDDRLEVAEVRRIFERLVGGRKKHGLDCELCKFCRSLH
jgi:hypothetical protein